MQRFTALTAAICAATAFIPDTLASPVTMDWVTVGNPADPTTGFGAVGYEYRIGKYEVINSQYAAFLNSVAASDPNELYNANMGSSARGGITRSGSDCSYTYSVKANMGDKPVNYVSWYDAARVSNWMTNGQGSGGTKSGTYTFDGVNSISGITRDLNNPNQVFIPTEDEWYKAAYHQPFAQGGDADDYWLYATRSNAVPTIATATSIGDVANPGQDVVNYDFGTNWNGQNGNVTTVGSAERTRFYGVFDMNGNVWEWNETLIGSSCGFRGGSLFDFENFLWSSNRFGINPASDGSFFGFRLASPVPVIEPCAGDANNDNVVTPLDISTVLGAFGTTGLTPNTGGEVTGDGQVTPLDISTVLGAFGTTCP